MKRGEPIQGVAMDGIAPNAMSMVRHPGNETTAAIALGGGGGDGPQTVALLQKILVCMEEQKEILRNR